MTLEGRLSAIRVNYLDASAIVKLLLPERGNEKLRRYFDENSAFLTTSLCLPEAVGVFSRRYKKDSITQEDYLAATETLLAFCRDGSLEIYDVRLSERQIFDEVEALIEKYRHSKKKRFDVSDAFQIVTLTKILPEVERTSLLLITADGHLATAARVEGLTVWNVMTEGPP